MNDSFKNSLKHITNLIIGFLIYAFIIDNVLAEQVRVAVAANFTKAAQEISRLFESQTSAQVSLSFGSTGQLYTQLIHGAPFDIMLAADKIHPQRLIAKGLAEKNSRITYATGRLVLYRIDPGPQPGPDSLDKDHFTRLAIANPATAPYGMAAMQTMKNLKVYDKIASRIVIGNNISQSYQFVATGNAELGFIALSQVGNHQRDLFWLVPTELHTPIAQDAVLMNTAKTNSAAYAFMQFLNSSSANRIKKRYGYEIQD